MSDLIDTCTALVLPIAGAWWLVAHVRRMHKRDARLAARWQQAQRLAHSGHGTLVHVNRVYQHARTGSKAYVRWPNGYVQDTWFDRFQASGGTWMVLSGNTGYGEHNKNPKVLYVDPERIDVVLPEGALASYTRHSKRVARRASKHSETAS